MPLIQITALQDAPPTEIFEELDSMISKIFELESLSTSIEWKKVCALNFYGSTRKTAPFAIIWRRSNYSFDQADRCLIYVQEWLARVSGCDVKDIIVVLQPVNPHHVAGKNGVWTT